MIHDMQNTQAMVEVSLRIKQVLKKIKKKKLSKFIIQIALLGDILLLLFPVL